MAGSLAHFAARGLLSAAYPSLRSIIKFTDGFSQYCSVHACYRLYYVPIGSMIVPGPLVKCTLISMVVPATTIRLQTTTYPHRVWDVVWSLLVSHSRLRDIANRSSAKCRIDVTPEKNFWRGVCMAWRRPRVMSHE